MGFAIGTEEEKLQEKSNPGSAAEGGGRLLVHQ